MTSKDILKDIGVEFKEMYVEDVSEALDKQEAKLRMIAITVDSEADRKELDEVISLLVAANEKLKTFIYG